ncbi:DNA mismatch endonuclease Vsr [Elizabethkingia anophelis]|nr:DNA mismatch endonuclease Vsr [Elizabethkingia anophelis]MCT3784877.1 DNA mismatch endonuclease Vsr [Elizabethkingia anophelis]MCT3792072.1 DNA mismatch endonuclease Vsr [Elizabethkingia anophelis]MCT3795652.1 DNA mismatch endonuclease Vsr [Elizabethkingia anophelis]MCT3799157.1 DNA mismatch endonuclease Vsr [Elizabethkingia anophelis]
MTDIFTSEKRSEIMSKISSVETKPEILVRKYLFAQGFRFRKNDKRLPGKPDVVLPKYKTVIFVHGCFWHGHLECKKSKLPETRREFWEKKISKNIIRDSDNYGELKNLGWNIVIIWECEINNKANREINFSKLLATLKSQSKQLQKNIELG